MTGACLSVSQGEEQHKDRDSSQLIFPFFTVFQINNKITPVGLMFCDFFLCLCRKEVLIRSPPATIFLLLSLFCWQHKRVLYFFFTFVTGIWSTFQWGRDGKEADLGQQKKAGLYSPVAVFTMLNLSSIDFPPSGSKTLQMGPLSMCRVYFSFEGNAFSPVRMHFGFWCLPHLSSLVARWIC